MREGGRAQRGSPAPGSRGRGRRSSVSGGSVMVGLAGICRQHADPAAAGQSDCDIANLWVIGLWRACDITGRGWISLGTGPARTLASGWPYRPAGSGSSDEINSARGGDRRRRGRRLDALSPRQEGLARRRADRAQGADLGLDLACRRPAAAVQHELLGRPDPQILGRALQDARGRDRPACRLPPGLQHPPRPHAGPLGRVHVLRGRRRHDRRQGQRPDARRRSRRSGRSARPTASSARSSIPRTATSSPPT